MKKPILAYAAAALLTLGACTTWSEADRAAANGAVIGAGVGLVSARILGADTHWAWVATLATATAGALVARNSATGECAYANGDGTVRRGPCSDA